LKIFKSVQMSVLPDQKITEPTLDRVDGSTPAAQETRSAGFGVVASPFNGVKIELGICIILGAILWLGADSITANEGAQLLMLLSYGLLATGWLVLRTRAVLRRCEAEHSA
jgi:hypothetical protein